MNITIAVTVTAASRMRNVRLVNRWIGWVTGLVGFAYLIWWLSDPWNLAGLLFGIIFLVFPELLGLIRHALTRRYGRVFTYTLTDAGVRARSAVTSLEFDWNAVTSIREVRPGWVVRLPAGGGFVLPERAMTPDQITEWRAFLAARSSAPA
ncbi:YcxB family protein [Kribbella sp. NPDC050459]|uniref:YcxB family protein n=1 Tax=Kribbella sp. NPDC050459 TaxID=3155785 RepID=UPI0033E94F18